MLEWFLVLIIIAALFHQTKAESLSCSIHSEGEKRKCFIQHSIIDVDKISPYLSFPYYLSYGKENCTVAFSSVHELNNFYIIKNSTQLIKNGLVDVLEINANDYDEIPFRIEASISPCQLSTEQILVVRGVEYEEECKKNCEIFLSSMVEFEPRHYNSSRWIALNLLNVNLTAPLKVEIISSSSCNVTCEYGSSFGCVNKNEILTLQNYSKWNIFDSNGLRTLNINASAQGYYCARIFLPRSCCPICSKTLFFKESYQYNLPSTNKEERSAGYGLLFLALCIANILLIALIFSVCSSGTSVKRSKEISDKEALNESLTELNVEFNFSTEKSQILLLYIKESNEFLILVKKLKKVLEMFFPLVLDPYAPDQVEEATENFTFWIDRILKCDRTKVIIFSHSPSPRRENPFDKLYQYALSSISHDPNFTHNYRRLFVIQFYPLSTNPALSNIVPCTRYKLPDHFEELIKDLTELRNINISDEIGRILLRKMDFKSALRMYMEKSDNFVEK